MKTTFISHHRIISFSLVWLVLCFYAPLAFSQSVTILPGGITPNQGGTVPRLSYELIMALPNPQDGDTAYDVTFHCMRLYKKNKWVKMLTDVELSSPSIIGWQIGGETYDTGDGIATDASGNVYVAGSFPGSATFENTVVTGNGPGTYTLFIAKFNSTGNLLWVQKIAYAPIIDINDLVLDTNGNIYVTGSFANSAVFGANTLNSYGNKDIFVAKYNTGGTLQWVQQAGGTQADDSRSMSVDGSGNIYLTGPINGNVNFGGNTYIGTGNSIFTAKYNTNGVFQWFRRSTPGTGEILVVRNIAADPSGKVTIVGHFTGNTAFGLTTLTSAGGLDAFVAQYDAAGNLLWAKRMGGVENDIAHDIAIDSENNVIVLGYFQATLNINSNTLISAGEYDVFIVKFSSTGVLGWITRDGGTKNEEVQAIAVDAEDNIYISGDFEKPSTFGSTILSGKGGATIFLAKYTKNGDFVWAKELGGEGQQSIVKIAADTKGNLYGVGYFNYDFIFDGDTFNSRGSNDVFVVRVKD